MRRVVLAAVVLAVAFAAAAPSPPAATTGTFSYRGTVTRVVDGDTVEVRLASGKRERVRLIGIDAAEGGACYASAAAARARQLALSKAVTLKGDPTQDTRDRYGRLLAYVWLPGGKDLGYQLVASGHAKVYVYRAAYQRLSAYRNAEAAAKGAAKGHWSACAGSTIPVPPPPIAPIAPSPPSTNCHSSYSPCLPIVADLDCADIRAMGVAPVRVLGSDPYRLDGDNDGLGCE